MDFIFKAAKRNLEFLAGAQERNEAAAKVVLDFAIETRNQSFVTAGAMVDLMAAQGKAMEEAAKTQEKVVEEAVRESREAVIKTAEKIARDQQN